MQVSRTRALFFPIDRPCEGYPRTGRPDDLAVCRAAKKAAQEVQTQKDLDQMICRGVFKVPSDCPRGMLERTEKILNIWQTTAQRRLANADRIQEMQKRRPSYEGALNQEIVKPYSGVAPLRAALEGKARRQSVTSKIGCRSPCRRLP